MKVLLLKSVLKLGKKDDIVDVSDGFANNALLSKGLAVVATASRIAERDRNHQNKTAKNLIQHNLLERAVTALEGRALVLKVKANAQGTLFSKIDNTFVARYLSHELRIPIDSGYISIPDTLVKTIGDYTIEVVDGNHRLPIQIRIIKE